MIDKSGVVTNQSCVHLEAGRYFLKVLVLPAIGSVHRRPLIHRPSRDALPDVLEEVFATSNNFLGKQAASISSGADGGRQLILVEVVVGLHGSG